MSPRGPANVKRIEAIRALAPEAACRSLRRGAPGLQVLPAAGVIAFTALVASGCFFNEAGLPPPTNAFYYPTGLAVSPGRSTMYVANSDFDLQYNGGTVQALDLNALRKELAPMLAGIRCIEGVKTECAPAFANAGASCDPTSPTSCGSGLTCNASMGTCGIIRDVCVTLPGDPSGGATTVANGGACNLPADCASGVCTDNTCLACKQDADCPGGTDASCPGKCASGVCQLTCVSIAYNSPSACSTMAPPYLAGGVATIGAFASGAVIAQNPAGSSTARLFVPVRGDPSITWFDIPDDTSATPATNPLSCGQTAADTHCADDHRLGVDPYDNFRDETIPVEPVGLDISEDGTDIVTAHQIPNGPAIGLSINDWNASATFSFALTQGVAASPSNVAHIPQPKLVQVAAAQAAAGTLSAPLNYSQGFLVTYNAAAQIDTYRVNNDPTSSPPRPYLTLAGTAPVTVNQTGTDSRGIAIDPTERAACEAACDSTSSVDVYDGCLANCGSNTPLQVYVANRTPPSLLLGQITTTVTAGDSGNMVTDTLEIFDNIAPLTQGPSNVAFGQVLGGGGSLQTMVFTVAFDTRHVFIYDPVSQTLSQPIETGRGPQAIAFDACTETGLNGKQICGPGEVPHAYLYVAHFTDSYLGVVDLDMSHPETFGTMFASIGVPVEPVETQ